MQGIPAWIGLFDIVFAAYFGGIFIPASVVFYITFLLLSNRGFKGLSEYSVVLLFRHTCNLMFVSP